MEVNKPFVFQTDSEIVRNTYNHLPNFLIEENEEFVKLSNVTKYCAIYFSSNNIYYPNDGDTFRKEIIEKNRFEWYGCRVEKAIKHIFIRDVQKQWYLEGINNEINSIEKLYKFLLKETDGYKTVFVGSSSGGYAAVLFGSMLYASEVFSFNGQFLLEDLILTSSENIDPIIFRQRYNEAINRYFSLRKWIKDEVDIFYFTSCKSEWDNRQYEHIKDLGVNTIFFDTSHHGIPFLKSALPHVINLERVNLLSFKNKRFHPILFTMKFVGIKNVLFSLFQAVKVKLNMQILLT